MTNRSGLAGQLVHVMPLLPAVNTANILSGIYSVVLCSPSIRRHHLRITIRAGMMTRHLQIDMLQQLLQRAYAASKALRESLSFNLSQTIGHEC